MIWSLLVSLYVLLDDTISSIAGYLALKTRELFSEIGERRRRRRVERERRRRSSGVERERRSQAGEEYRREEPDLQPRKAFVEDDGYGMFPNVPPHVPPSEGRRESMHSVEFHVDSVESEDSNVLSFDQGSETTFHQTQTRKPARLRRDTLFDDEIEGLAPRRNPSGRSSPTPSARSPGGSVHQQLSSLQGELRREYENDMAELRHREREAEVPSDWRQAAEQAAVFQQLRDSRTKQFLSSIADLNKVPANVQPPDASAVRRRLFLEESQLALQVDNYMAPKFTTLKVETKDVKFTFEVATSPDLRARILRQQRPINEPLLKFRAQLGLEPVLEMIECWRQVIYRRSLTQSEALCVLREHFVGDAKFLLDRCNTIAEAVTNIFSACVGPQRIIKARSQAYSLQQGDNENLLQWLNRLGKLKPVIEEEMLIKQFLHGLSQRFINNHWASAQNLNLMLRERGYTFKEARQIVTQLRVAEPDKESASNRSTRSNQSSQKRGNNRNRNSNYRGNGRSNGRSNNNNRNNNGQNSSVRNNNRSNRNQRGQSTSNQNRSGKTSATGKKEQGLCGICGKNHPITKCPEVVCYNCGAKGHIASQCSANVNQVVALNTGEDKPVSRDVMSISSPSSANLMMAVCRAGPGKESQEIFAVYDTGSFVHLIYEDIARACGMEWYPYEGPKLIHAGRGELDCVGTTHIQLQYCHDWLDMVCVVVKGKAPALFSRDAFKRNGTLCLDATLPTDHLLRIGDSEWRRPAGQQYICQVFKPKTIKPLEECTKGGIVAEDPDDEIDIQEVDFPTAEGVDPDWRRKCNLEMSPQQAEDMDATFKKLKDNFSEYPHFKHRIADQVHIDTGGVTFAQKRRIFKGEQQKVAQEACDKLLNAGVAERIDANEAQCISNLTFVKKKNGDYRACLDLRQLNKHVKPDYYPTRSVKEIQDASLPKATVFIGLDLKNGYMNLPIAEADKGKVAFWDHEGGVLQMAALPFGFINASQLFGRWVDKMMQKVNYRLQKRNLSDKANVSVYVDDILLESTTLDGLLQVFAEMVDVLVEEKVSVNISKFEMGDRIRFLGQWRVDGGFEVDEDKVAALLEMRMPTNKKELLSILGALRFHSSITKDLGRILAPLNPLTGKTKFVFTKEHEKALREGIEAVADSTIRYIPDFNKEWRINCDASDLGIGAVLYQMDDDGVTERPVYFASKAFSETEKKYATVEQEAYALVWSVRYFREYINMGKVKVFTDHKALTWIINAVKDCKASPKVTRWLYTLMGYDIEVEHVSGADNHTADVLSRIHPESPSVNAITMDGPPNVGGGTGDSNAAKEDDDDDDAEKSAEKREEDRDLPQESPLPGYNEDAFWTIAECLLKDEPFPQELRRPTFDSVVAQVKRYLPELELVDDVLVYRVDKPDSFNNKGMRRYVKVAQRNEVLFRAHDAPTSGHRGVDKTYQNLADRVWWPNMNSDVREYIRECGICQRMKNRRSLQAKLQPPDVQHCLWTWHIDLVGQLKTTERGNKYILQAKDPATKYVVALPLTSKSAEEVARAIVQGLILPYGYPHRIVSDQGGEFCNKLNDALCLQSGISKRTTAAYHPAANGVVERANQSLMSVLRAIAEPDQSNWDLCLATAAFAVNSHKPRGLTHSSFFLMFGRQPYTQIDVTVGTIPRQFEKLDWWKQLDEAREACAALEGRFRWKDKIRLDARVQRDNYKVGDLVLVKFHKTGQGRSRKLAAKQQGPYKILSIHDDGVTAELKHEYSDHRLRRHVSDLYPFYGDTDDNEYQVEKIVDERIQGKEKFYKVRWKGYDSTHDTWVRESELGGAQEVLQHWRGKKENPDVPQTVHDIHAKEGRGMHIKYLCQLHPDDGPDDFVRLKKKQIRNKSVIDGYLRRSKEECRTGG